MILSLAVFVSVASISSINCGLVINSKTREGNVVRLVLQEDLSNSTVWVYYKDWDDAEISLLVDFKHGINIFYLKIRGEIDLAQPAVQHMCFITYLSPNDFIDPSAVSKLRQKTPDAIRLSENFLGVVSSLMNLAVSRTQSGYISPHIAELCRHDYDIIYTSELDLEQVSKEYNREMYKLLLPTQRIQPVADPCSDMHEMVRPCQCFAKLSFDWYPCSLKYCKGLSETMTKCGVKACAVIRLFEFAVTSRRQCWWEWYTSVKQSVGLK